MGDEGDANRDSGGSSGPLLFYNEVVIDHFVNPRNVGELAEGEADGYALVGDPSCGDQMKLWIAVEGGSRGSPSGPSAAPGPSPRAAC